ncbi:serine/threonine protein kinase [Nannocystis radixulma]|uniref:Serine/threonine-protein kinase n=1 Tax=Nannocystis radixulma TaxID=2995305 RepID=A0ABT5BS76_9BACT|nr:serine/threonine-protein kinase [Nannocystis radixulma]MDC0675771.1 serine/threonine-protein kinase [Nannocystis radixulma]
MSTLFCTLLMSVSETPEDNPPGSRVEWLMPRMQLTTQLGPYRILACIGRGGMGEVYEVEHLQLGRRRALKVLRPELFDDERLRTRFIKEITALAKVEHPHVVDILDVGDVQGQVYYAMEYLEGITLRERAHDLGGRMTWERLHPILLQLADALAKAHAAGVIHRDLKPSNIMLVRRDGRDDFVKIVDFGIAKVLELSGPELITGTSEFFGSIAYMSPEQAAQARTIDARSDMYSLGSMTYELLSGHPPFVGPPVRVLAQLAREPPPDLRDRCPELSTEVAAFVHRLLNKEPAQRFADMAELATALRRLAPHAGVTAATLPAATPIADDPATRPSRWVTFSLLALAVVVVTTVALVLRNEWYPPVIDGTDEVAAASVLPPSMPEPEAKRAPETPLVEQVIPPPPLPDTKQPATEEPAEPPEDPPPSKPDRDQTKGSGIKKVKKELPKCGASEWSAFVSAVHERCGVSWSFPITVGAESGKLVIRLNNRLIEEANATLCVIESFRAAHDKCDAVSLGEPRERKVR